MTNVSLFKKQLISCLSLVLLVGISSCEGLNSFSTNPNHRLSFSVDTLSFDTIFTTFGSATKQFMAYNPNEEALKITTIQLASGSASKFRINVDGRKGTIFQNIEVWKKDSLYIAIEVTINPNHADQPLVVEDSVLFDINGTRQAVLLQAYGQDVFLIKGGHVLNSDTTLTANRPYLVYDSLLVAEGATLTLEKGVQVYLHNKAKIRISGTLKANGTSNQPVVFRGSRRDNMLVDGISTPYDRIAGQWDGLVFSPTSFNNLFEHVIARNGHSGLTFEASHPNQLKIQISNSQITNMSYNILQAVNCHIEASNSQFTNATDSTVALIGGKHQFTHCTLANPGVLGKSRTPNCPCLILGNKLTVNNETLPYPLLEAYFDNCIVDGSNAYDTTKLYKGEIMLSVQHEAEQAGSEQFNYRFQSCYLGTARIENSRFVENVFGKRPTFLKTGIKDDHFIFDYRLANKSAGIGKANRAVAEKYPTDLYGTNRLTSETGPSVGAYEYVYQEEKK